MKGYKAFNSDWTCRDFKYEVGKTYEHESKIALFKSGFHFCQSLNNIINYYTLSPTTHFCEVEALGNVMTDGDISVTNKIKIIKEILFNDVLIKLSNDKAWFVRYAVAINTYAHVDVLTKLSEDNEWRVRYAVAENNNTSVDVLTKLSEDKNNLVRCAVARNTNAPVDVLTKLSEDKEWLVRRATLENAI